MKHISNESLIVTFVKVIKIQLKVISRDRLA